MKSYFKPLFLIGDGGGDGELIPPGQIGSVIGDGEGDVENGAKSVFETMANDSLTTMVDTFTTESVEEYVPSEFTPPIDQPQG